MYRSHLSGGPLPVVEDAAQVHGAVRGSRSAAVSHSSWPTTNVDGMGDGGAVATDDEELATELRLLRR